MPKRKYEGNVYKKNNLSGIRSDARRRLQEDIDNNEFDADAEVKVVDDPSAWATQMGMQFSHANEERIADGKANAMKMANKALNWLRNSPEGKDIHSMMALRAVMGVPAGTWSLWVHRHKEFEFIHEQIRELIAARVHEKGMRGKEVNPIFAMFSLKNQYSEEFKDKIEPDNVLGRVEVIQISQGTEQDIKTAIEENTKKLNE